LAERLDHARDEEIRIALGEVAKICRLRLLDLVAADDGATVSQA
jgi:2-oxo-4-hydroxy-4-carboxy--5-ureidoimidazoline (OHCU) decarboxylase